MEPELLFAGAGTISRVVEPELLFAGAGTGAGVVIIESGSDMLRLRFDVLSKTKNIQFFC